MRPQVLRGGLVFDGLGSPARELDVLVDSGAIAALLPPGSAVGEDVEPVDVRGCWVTPASSTSTPITTPSSSYGQHSANPCATASRPYSSAAAD
ncbi:hypothetical protein [Nannocystis pusilla]|uniref:hypothetical protein n=1 Tax=Nannocystis pusilla TaxID=889268 RepID=UPI003B7D6132